MKYERFFHSDPVMLVALTADVTRLGGMIDTSEARLDMLELVRHVMIGNLAAAIFKKRGSDELRLVIADSERGRLVNVGPMTQAEADSFVQKRGVYWHKPTR